MEKVQSYISENKDKFVNELVDWLKIPSVSTDFKTIGTIDGAGFSTSINAYVLIDENPAKGNNYYRLKQTDFDGRFTYSQIRKVNFEKQNNFNVYPNPVSIGEIIQLEVPSNGSYEINITDAVGKIVYGNSSESSNQESIKINTAEINLNTGIYFLFIKGNENNFSQKLIIKK